MVHQYIVYKIIFSLVAICILNFNLVYGYTDIGQFMANKYYLTVNNQTHTIFYFLHDLNTSNADISNMDYVGKISSISVEPSKNAMLITLDNILTNDELSVGFDSGIILGDSGQFTVFVDGQEKGFATSTAFGNDRVLTVVTPSGTHHVEIVGTELASEFGSLAGMISAISLILVLLLRKFSILL